MALLSGGQFQFFFKSQISNPDVCSFVFVVWQIRDTSLVLELFSLLSKEILNSRLGKYIETLTPIDGI